jgi:pyruvate dehydrogenase E2 component (dihydrolipoamide acetyltransferase)
MEEGRVARWLKHPGDTVHKGDVLAEIETDKATMDLEAYDEGIFETVLVAEGETAPIGRPIAVLGTGGPSAALPTSDATAAPVETAAEPPSMPPKAPETAPTLPPAPPDVVPETPVPSLPARRDRAAAWVTTTSPLARALARRNGIDLGTLTGSGPGGRVVRADVEEAIARMAPAGAPSPVPSSPVPSRMPVGPSPATAEDDVEEVLLTTIRRVTAERLTKSAAVPHFSLTSVVDAEPLLALRADINETIAASQERVSVTDLLVKACARALRDHPQANAAWGGDKILRHRRIHVGIAVAVPDGLVVPVVHDADRLALTEVARGAHRLEERARVGQLSVEDLDGGTFTLSNLGMLGVDHFTAVLNPPQAAVLAVGAAKPEAVVRDGEVVVRTTMKVTLSVDHRVLDGATAAAFLADLVRHLEHPLGIVI